MKINNSQDKRKTILITSIALVVAISSFSLYYFLQKHNEEEKRKSDSLTSIDANKSKDDQDKSIPADENASTNDDKTIVPSDPVSNPEEASNLEKPSITRATQSTVNIRVSAIFSQPAYGQCTATFERAGQKSVVKSVPIVVGPSYYTCNGFLIPVSEFPAKGTWTVTVTHEQNGKSTSSDTQSVNIE